VSRYPQRPEGVSDATVRAVGALSEAFEWIERARGRLYDFHQMIGHADALVDEAATELESAGFEDVAADIRLEIVGRNVIAGRWTFQLVEEFDDRYYGPVKDRRKEHAKSSSGVKSTSTRPR